MKISTRDKRALAALGVAVAGMAIYMLVSSGSDEPKVVGSADSIPSAERRLARARQTAATVQGKRELLKKVQAEVAAREKGILQAQTAAQAQAQLLNIVRRIGKAQTPPIDFGSVEMSSEVVPLGEYGEVQITVPFVCHAEELVNFLAALTQQPEAIATKEIRMGGQDPKQKTISVRVMISGVVPHRLVPEKKGPATF